MLFVVQVALIGVVWPVFIVLIDNAVKKHDGNQYVSIKKWARIDFDTKLGMHSPVANYEK